MRTRPERGTSYNELAGKQSEADMQFKTGEGDEEESECSTDLIGWRSGMIA